MNQYFAPAWLAFGHTFAVEKEHDQAISAYATSARLIPGYSNPEIIFILILFNNIHNNGI
jgi:anaphase-promoting complex subunit 6